MKKPIIGILGGICSGKSTVAQEFAKLGCEVIDADQIAHELLQTEPIKEKVTNYFSPSILDSEGKIDHKTLANDAFSSQEKLAQLNNIIHPEVVGCVEELIDQYSRVPGVKAIVLDMPLLLEIGWEKKCDVLIFVVCDYDERLKRAKKRHFWTKINLKLEKIFRFLWTTRLTSPIMW
ncbi:MAG: dephospho-CoA kinase [Planctomycetota bacterium]|jgi:dephospho-CoA kinase